MRGPYPRNRGKAICRMPRGRESGKIIGQKSHAKSKKTAFSSHILRHYRWKTKRRISSNQNSKRYEGNEVKISLDIDESSATTLRWHRSRRGQEKKGKTVVKKASKTQNHETSSYRETLVRQKAGCQSAEGSRLQQIGRNRSKGSFCRL